MKFNTVIYIGVINDEKSKIIGGFAVANQRNIDEYLRQGFTVEKIKYPSIQKKNLISIFIYCKRWINVFLNCIKILKRNRNNSVIVHFTPLYKYFIYIEYLLGRICKLYSKNLLIDIRAGSFINYFNNKGAIYRLFIRKFLKLSKFVTVEGEKYIPFIKHNIDLNLNIHYYPNYVRDNQILTKPRRNIENGNIQIVYFGRIHRDKGILTIINTHKLLKSGYNVRTVIIGNISDDEFKDEIMNKIKDESIEIQKPLLKEEINKILINSHFFVFPTIHPGEGHSNALAESMGFGLVPIVSNNGFNKNVVANSGMVIDKNGKPQDYFKAIDYILSNSQWNQMSENARMRILNLYSNREVSSKFFNFINK